MEQDDKNSFVVNTTITEIILLLFFLLLLLFGYFYTTQNKATESLNNDLIKLQQEKKALEVELNALTANVPVDQKAKVQSVLVSLNRLDFMLAEKTNQAKELENQIKAYQDLIVRLKKNPALAEMKQEDVQSHVQLLACKQMKTDLAADRAETQSCKVKVAAQSKALVEANRRNQEMVTKLAQATGHGDEYPACWRNDQNKIDFIYDVTLTGDMLEVKRAWPDSRAEDMESFGDEKALAGKTVSLNDFLTKTRKMYNSSVEQACRHYVRIIAKKSEVNPKIFENYRGIQRHFYKVDVIQ